MKECTKCGFNNEYGCCECPSVDKWYACPIENKKPENIQAIEECAKWAFFCGMLKEIETGEITVKYDSWSFAGGRDYGDWDIYRLYKSDTEYGRLDVSYDRCEIEITVNNETRLIELPEKSYVILLRTLITALKRDDQEFVTKLTVNGEFNLPRDYCDISREDVLSGKWPYEQS